jgi:bifunctional oligoribonuclease and PAP phosphatase NrnA
MISAESLKKAVVAIQAAKQVLVTTHTRPDGDAAGCVAVVCELLRSMGKEAHPLWLSPLPTWYGSLFDAKVPVLGVDVPRTALDGQPYSSCDMVLIVDTNSYQQLADIARWLKSAGKRILVLDHHVTSDHLGDVEVTDTTAAAAGIVLYELIRCGGWELSANMANALFTAISTDTGWFRFTNVDGRTLRVAGELVEAGARPAELYRRLYQNFTAARMRLLVRLMENMKVELAGRLAVAYLRKNDFAETGASHADTENLIDEFQRIDTVEAVVMLSEQDDGSFRCSMRSRGLVDVARIAAANGGGGHKNAAGATLRMPLEKAVEALTEAVAAQL